MMWAFGHVLKGLTGSAAYPNSGEVSTAVGLAVWIGFPIAYFCILWLIGWRFPVRSCEPKSF